MSRLLPDFLSGIVTARLTISLGADGVAIVQTKGLNKSLAHQQFIAGEKADWQSHLQQLDAALSQLKLTKHTVSTIILSSDFVRYLILPAQPFNMNSAEKIAYIQAAYRDIYGAVADGWQIKCDDTAPNQNMLAVAVDAPLIAALSQLTAQHQLKLHSVQPYLMAAFNELTPQIARKNGYLALLEQSKLLLIRLQNGTCQHLRTLNFHQDWQLVLQQALQRENALNENSELADQQLMIYAPAQKNTAIDSIQGWKIQIIGLKKGLNIALNNPQYSMLEAVL